MSKQILKVENCSCKWKKYLYFKQIWMCELSLVNYLFIFLKTSTEPQSVWTLSFSISKLSLILSCASPYPFIVSLDESKPNSFTIIFLSCFKI
jgi:hypothetical protein